MDAHFAIDAAATAYLARFGLGTQGKMLGISKMFQDRDLAVLQTQVAVSCLRPRGVLSGFLAVLPSVRRAVYVPPVGAKMTACEVRMRLAEEVWADGAILSAYWASNKQLVIDDILVWRGESLLRTPFVSRWEIHQANLCRAWQPDPLLQGCDIRFAEYMSLEELGQIVLGEREVVEFVLAEATGIRRLVWVPTREEAASASQQRGGGEEDVGVSAHTTDHLIARRETAVGPDIYSLWRSATEKLPGWALVRTLAVSKALRAVTAEEIRVKTTWNKMFERHEVVGII